MEVQWTSMPSNGCVVDRRTPGTKEVFARSGASFSLVAFFWPNKRKPPRVQGRSHPQLAFEFARQARETLIKLQITSKILRNTFIQPVAWPPRTDPRDKPDMPAVRRELQRHGFR